MNDQLFSTLPGYTGSKETPCHQIKLQLKETGGCDRHNLRLLSKCPNCDARFKIPAERFAIAFFEQFHYSSERLFSFADKVAT
ncbi:MAG: hypothetical protein HEQ31_18260 [Dolichospermum sp. OL03]|nr:hypothetical protein [Dolichospermum sp. OL01]MCO5798622.1 hypothetical protein [Dolichospermum sp. OL03]MCS6283255.1 hypothetical protein [Dolichospermum sp.]